MGLESVVTWTLTPDGTGTHLRMEQSGFRPDQQQAYQGAKFGWQKFFAEPGAGAGADRLMPARLKPAEPPRASRHKWSDRS